MNTIFKLCKRSPCNLAIVGLEEENEEYLYESDIVISTRTYTYNQSVTVNALYTINGSGEENKI